MSKSVLLDSLHLSRGPLDKADLSKLKVKKYPNVDNVNNEDLRMKAKEVLRSIGRACDSFASQFTDYRASDVALAKLSKEERATYEELFHYANSKDHGMNAEMNESIKKWNEEHPDCQIRSQYDSLDTKI